MYVHSSSPAAANDSHNGPKSSSASGLTVTFSSSTVGRRRGGGSHPGSDGPTGRLTGLFPFIEEAVEAAAEVPVAVHCPSSHQQEVDEAVVVVDADSLRCGPRRAAACLHFVQVPHVVVVGERQAEPGCGIPVGHESGGFARPAVHQLPLVGDPDLSRRRRHEIGETMVEHARRVPHPDDGPGPQRRIGEEAAALDRQDPPCRERAVAGGADRSTNPSSSAGEQDGEVPQRRPLRARSTPSAAATPAGRRMPGLASPAVDAQAACAPSARCRLPPDVRLLPPRPFPGRRRGRSRRGWPHACRRNRRTQRGRPAKYRRHPRTTSARRRQSCDDEADGRCGRPPPRSGPFAPR